MSIFKLKAYSLKPNPLIENEISILTKKELQEVLKKFQQLDPQFVDLVSPSGDCLTLGVGGVYACVMYTQASSDPPYLVALGNTDTKDEFVEFDAGGTPTPIPLSQCLSFDKMVEIAIYFFRNEGLPQNVAWEEI